MRRVYLFSIFTLLIQFKSLSTDFKWKIVTSPYRNYIYPGQTGLKYNLTYSYNTEAKALRNYLKTNYNVRSSESIGRIFRDISTGVYFERYFDIKVKYIKSIDTLMLVVKYENGDSTLEKYTNINGSTKIYIPLTKYKAQHDFTIGKPKSPKQKGLVTSVNVFVSSKRHAKSHVSVLTKLITEADMPGIVSKIKGRSVLK